MPPSSAVRRVRLFSNRRDYALPYLLIAPTVIVLLALSIYPLIFAIKTSFQTGNADSAQWSLANFTRLFTDKFFFAALGHTFIYAAVALTLEFLLGLALALLLNSAILGRGLFRALMLIPMMLPPVVVGVVWRLMYNADFGAINGILKTVGANTEHFIWTASPRLILCHPCLCMEMDKIHFLHTETGDSIRSG